MLKAGGLALVIKAHLPYNLGKCVTLEFSMPPGSETTAPDGSCIENWTRQEAWLATGDVRARFMSGRISSGYSMFLPDQLLPLGDDPDQITQERERGLLKGEPMEENQ